MAIAKHPILSKVAHGPLLPPSWRTLYELTKVPDAKLEEAIAEAHIRPDMERSDVAEQARRHRNANVLNRTIQTDAAEAAGFTRTRLADAAVVLDYAPDLCEKIMAGGMNIQHGPL